MQQHVGFAGGGQGELAESRCKALENVYCFGLEESSRKWSYLGQLRKKQIKYFFLKKKKIFYVLYNNFSYTQVASAFATSKVNSVVLRYKESYWATK